MSKPDWGPLFAAGIHAIEFSAFEAACLSGALATPRRIELFARLSIFVQQLRETGLTGKIWLDGSFTTEKPDPSDIDITVFIDQNSLLPLDANQMKAVDDLLDRTTAAERFGLDLYVDIAGDFHREAYWRGVFGFCHDGITPKGIASVGLSL